MYRYIALAWNRTSRSQSETALCLARRLQLESARWRCVARAHGLLVFHSGARAGSSEAYCLADRGGVVLGKLFAREKLGMPDASVLALTGDISARIVATGGRHLINQFWGRYVAFVQDQHTGVTWVLRDPGGNLPCLLVVHGDVSIFCSHPDAYEELGLPAFDINWEFLAVHLVFQGLHVQETGLQGVAEIHAGECVEIRNGGARRSLYWDPLAIARSDPIESPENAVAQVRHATRACVQAWASSYAGIIHTLSGGLDSSIVLACLRDIPDRQKVVCVNYFTEGREADEREFARSVARACGFSLIEHRRHPASIRLEGLLNVRPFVRPCSYRYYLDVGRFEAQLAQEHGASAIFGGGGGDQLYYQGRPVLAVTDYASLCGLRPALMRIAGDVARIEGRTVWSALRRGLPNALLYRAWSPFDEPRRYASLVSDELLHRSRWSDEVLHPWVRRRDGAPYGKLWHALTLSIPQVFYDPLGAEDDAESVKPLVSQPLIELCLRIPTYVHIDRGWSRGIARRAFARELPRAIAARRTKGGGQDHIMSIIRANAAFVRDLLVDGELVRHGLLDRAKLIQALEPPHAGNATVFPELEDHLSTEIWLRKWSPGALRAAA